MTGIFRLDQHPRTCLLLKPDKELNKFIFVISVCLKSTCHENRQIIVKKT